MKLKFTKLDYIKIKAGVGNLSFIGLKSSNNLSAFCKWAALKENYTCASLLGSGFQRVCVPAGCSTLYLATGDLATSWLVNETSDMQCLQRTPSAGSSRAEKLCSHKKKCAKAAQVLLPLHGNYIKLPCCNDFVAHT